MSKVTIIRCCGECIFHWRGICLHAGDLHNKPVEWDDMPDLCPLPDLPEKADENPYDNADKDSFIVNSYEAGFAKGWNICLRIITGEGKNEQGNYC